MRTNVLSSPFVGPIGLLKIQSRRVAPRRRSSWARGL